MLLIELHCRVFFIYDLLLAFNKQIINALNFITN